VLAFNLSVTFWIGESFMGLSGLLMHLPILGLLLFRLVNPQVMPSTSYPSRVHAGER
jgi:putative membrane protein